MIGDRHGYLNGVLRDDRPARPWRPPSATSDHGLAPAGHDLELDLVKPYVRNGTRMHAFDRHTGRCACGLEITSETLGVVYGPPTATTVVAAWVRHLADHVDPDDLRQLRRDLIDAEHTARYGRPYHRRTA